jgi:hypothetical protein
MVGTIDKEHMPPASLSVTSQSFFRVSYPSVAFVQATVAYDRSPPKKNRCKINDFGQKIDSSEWLSLTLRCAALAVIGNARQKSKKTQEAQEVSEIGTRNSEQQWRQQQPQAVNPCATVQCATQRDPG